MKDFTTNLISVKDLKALLADVPDETLVLLGSDAEGNSFSPAAGYTKNARYVPAPKVWQRGWTFSEEDSDFNPNQGKIAILLWPLH